MPTRALALTLSAALLGCSAEQMDRLVDAATEPTDLPAASIPASRTAGAAPVPGTTPAAVNRQTPIDEPSLLSDT